MVVVTQLQSDWAARFDAKSTTHIWAVHQTFSRSLALPTNNRDYYRDPSSDSSEDCWIQSILYHFGISQT